MSSSHVNAFRRKSIRKNDAVSCEHLTDVLSVKRPGTMTAGDEGDRSPNIRAVQRLDAVGKSDGWGVRKRA